MSDLDTLIAEHERLCAAIVAHGRALVALRPEAHAATANYVNDARIGLWRALCGAYGRRPRGARARRNARCAVRPALDTPRGARYLSPALLSRPSSALVRVGPAPVTRCEPHRLGVAILRMITSRSLMRCLRGADEIHARALASLPPRAPAAHAQRQVWCDRIFDAVEVLPASERVPVLLCVAYALHEHAPTGEVWADVARAIDALHRGAESVEARAAVREKRAVRPVIVAEHETIAAAIVAEVLA